MGTGMAEMDGPHWAFSLAVYGREDVPGACLRLQDGIGLDVNVLLLALFFAGSRNGTITAGTIATADAEIATWRTEVVVALRRLRILLKDGPPGAPRPATNELRAGIKSAELSAEQIEQAWLAGWFADHVGAGAAATTPDDFATVARCVAGYYAGQEASTLASELLAAADVVARAASAELSGKV
ncbi:TIGR02444 family protein [Starkeya sp. ORNL1]|uniref:TIGR02444 family protein n=1 Tax=Starkeya sp. ORNL1 TaxID=2709380 RepID=UPI0014648AB3|nr:TIGR02444 family protein [Starkeya sp. ORNL1]QJP16021.1 TIGR02444 family protein [Starkeya sp. ORNL1]